MHRTEVEQTILDVLAVVMKERPHNTHVRMCSNGYGLSIRVERSDDPGTHVNIGYAWGGQHWYAGTTLDKRSWSLGPVASPAGLVNEFLKAVRTLTPPPFQGTPIVVVDGVPIDGVPAGYLRFGGNE